MKCKHPEILNCKYCSAYRRCVSKARVGYTPGKRYRSTEYLTRTLQNKPGFLRNIQLLLVKIMIRIENQLDGRLASEKNCTICLCRDCGNWSCERAGCRECGPKEQEKTEYCSCRISPMQNTVVLCLCGQCEKPKCERFTEGCICNTCNGEPKDDFLNCLIPREGDKKEC